jgi:hypothetical protein
MSKFAKIFSITTLLIVFIGTSTNIANALSGSDFNPGRIIDDSVFFESASMNTTQIQNFLNVKVPTCDTNGQQTLYDSAYGDTVTRAIYSSRRGVNTPFTCMKDFRADTSNIAPESGICGGYTGATNESAATIIYKVAQSCGISPKVLLVTLQKEQSLVTDDWPWPVQYEKAMGAFCPDTAPCNSGYGGFFKQVYYGANRFKVYGANPTYFNYRANRNNTIYFNPGPCQTYTSGTCTKYYGNKYDSNGNSVPDITYCGSTTVYITSQATADLYIYTPYQPNKAALDNLYDTGDYCSAYGNRNFWRMFSDWFGTTYGDLFHATLVSQSQSVSAAPGQSATVTLSYRNNGQWSWHDDTVSWPGIPPLRLATANPTARSSVFSYGWYNGYSPNAQAKVYEADGTTLAPEANQHTINPGQIISYTFPITVPWPMPAGSYSEYFKPILAGSNIDLGETALTPINIDVPPIFRALATGQSEWPSLTPGESTDLLIRYRNTGRFDWRDDTIDWPGLPPLYLYTGNGNGISIFSYSWPTRSIAAKTFNKIFESDGSFNPSSNQHIVHPGQIVEFKVTVSAPWNISTGKYIEYFKPALKDSSINLGAATGFEIQVPAWRAVLVQPTPDLGLARGDSAWVCVKYQNKGAYTWHDSSVSWPGVPNVVLNTANSNNVSIFSYLWDDTSAIKRTAIRTFDSVYAADGNLVSPNPHTVSPNQIAKFCFIETTPWSANTNYTYMDYVKPILQDSGIVLTQPSQYAGARIWVP